MQLRMLGRVDLRETVEAMQAFTGQRTESTPDALWVCEHAPHFTQGLAGRADHLLAPGDIPVVATNRGGQVTFHGPGQVVAYPLVDLRRAGFVVAQRGASGGYRLGKQANEISIADVIRAMEGPLAEVRGERPGQMHYEGPAEHLQDVWIAVRAALRSVLEKVTIADVLSGKFPRAVSKLIDDPDAWKVR